MRIIINHNIAATHQHRCYVDIGMSAGLELRRPRGRRMWVQKNEVLLVSYFGSGDSELKGWQFPLFSRHVYGIEGINNNRGKQTRALTSFISEVTNLSKRNPHTREDWIDKCTLHLIIALLKSEQLRFKPLPLMKIYQFGNTTNCKTSRKNSSASEIA